MLILSVILKKLEKYQDHISCSFACKIVCIDNKFTKRTIIYRGENAAYEFIKAILTVYAYCKKIMDILIKI